MNWRIDVLALVAGLLAIGAAGLALGVTLVGSVDWALVKIVAPLALVVIGVVGLVVSRRS